MLLSNPLYRRQIRWLRAAGVSAAAAAAAIGIGVFPLPCRVGAPLILQPITASFVYVSVPGTLAKITPAGTVVEQGQEIARLVDLDTEREVLELVGQRDQQRLQVQNLKLRLAEDPSVAAEIPPAEEALADMENRLRQRQLDQQRMILRSPSRGMVLPPPTRLDRPYQAGRLNAWRGTPLESRNLHSFLETGTLLCLVGDPQRLEASLVIDQADMKFVRCGQCVRMQCDEVPGGVLEGSIIEIAKIDLKVAPRELAADRQLPVRVDSEGLPRPTETSYQARVALDRYLPGLLTGGRGWAKIAVSPQPLGQRLVRYLEQTFNFSL